MMMRFLGLVAILGVTVVPLQFVDAPSALIVLLCSFGILLMSFGCDWRSGFRALNAENATREELLVGHAAMARLRSAIAACGTIGSLIGVVIMLSNEDPSGIGGGMAILLMTQVYAIALAFCVVHPMATVLARRLDEASR